VLDPHLLASCEGFDWDNGNAAKNQDKHGVSPTECEQIFFRVPLLLDDDLLHGHDGEERYLALGHTDRNRRLLIVFTIRDRLIRVISARDMTKAERRIYETHR
jgi:uncharacterized protein